MYVYKSSVVKGLVAITLELTILSQLEMAGEGNTISRRGIGELLNKEYPTDSVQEDHIPYFYFQVEVRGNNLTEYNLFANRVDELFPRDKHFGNAYIVENFGNVNHEEVFKITYFVKYNDNSPPRDVEQVLDGHRLWIREFFHAECGSEDVYVLMSRCCNYFNGGIN